MKVKCLVENTSCNPEIEYEHGLSLYIETGSKKILFDAGQSDLILRNAEKMGVNLKNVDFAVLSHGHYDHGGGLEYFFEINKTAPVYITEKAFEPHYNGTEKYIGLNPKLKNSGRFVILHDDFQISKGIKIYSCKNMKNIEPIKSYGLNKVENQKFLPDDFEHEHYLEITESGKKILFSGCSHRGIINIENYFKPDVLIGGFHFKKLKTSGEDAKILEQSAKKLNEFSTLYYTCHCTGEEQYEYLKKYMKNNLLYLSAGQTAEIL